MDDFDHFWRWANKPRHSLLTIPADLHHAVTSLPREAWRDRAKVNEAARLLRGTAAAEISRYAGPEITFQCCLLAPLRHADPLEKSLLSGVDRK